MAGCEVEARKAYPQLYTDDNSGNQAADLEFECMKYKGYDFDNDDCPPVTDVKEAHYQETKAECYRKPWPWE
jgi:hypothetical protein